MARIHYWQYIVDDEGNPLANADVRIYLGGTSTEANIFLHSEYGGYSTSSVVGLQTNENGFFEVWIGDQFELEGGYQPGQVFKVTWTKGSVTETIEKITFLSPLHPVLFTSDEVRNKMISNFLANKIDTHVDSIVPSSSPHDIESYTLLQLNRDSTDDYYNKVVSNKLLYQMYQIASQSVSASIDVSGAQIYTETIATTGWSATGSDYYKDVVHNLNDNYPVVKLWKSSRENIVPDEIKKINKDTVRIFVTENIEMNVVVIG